MPHKDLEVRRAYLREWKRRNRGRYAHQTKILDASRHANERAAKYGAPGTITTDDVRAALASGACHYCGGSDRLGIDHVEPLHGGGANAPENIVPCCHSCNASKWRGDKPGRWAREHDACSACGGTEIPHLCHGLCARCHARERYQRERANRATGRAYLWRPSDLPEVEAVLRGRA